jgi:hypothetical protein
LPCKEISPFHFIRVVSCIIQSTLSLSLSPTPTHILSLSLSTLPSFVHLVLPKVFFLARSSVSDMSGRNFGDSMELSSSGRSSGSRRGKRGGGGGGTDRPKQPQRGLGVAQLEKIRLQSEMVEYFHPLGQHPSLIHRTGSLSLVSDDAGVVFAKRFPSLCVVCGHAAIMYY